MMQKKKHFYVSSTTKVKGGHFSFDLWRNEYKHYLFMTYNFKCHKHYLYHFKPLFFKFSQAKDDSLAIREISQSTRRWWHRSHNNEVLTQQRGIGMTKHSVATCSWDCTSGVRQRPSKPTSNSLTTSGSSVNDVKQGQKDIGGCMIHCVGECVVAI